MENARPYKVVLAFFAIALIFGSCTEGKKDSGTDEDVTKMDTTEEKSDKQASEEIKQYYQIPSPDEVFTIINKYKEDPQKDLLNNPDNHKKYVGKKEKALNFGIYSTDLAYCSIFDLGPEALDYFKVVEKMGEELEISAAFSEETLNSIEGNLSNSDSLSKISKETYLKAYQYLEKNDRGPTLALVVAGGWMEALNLMTHMLPEKDYDPSAPLTKRIADQKLTLENLVKFMEKHDDDKMVASTIKDIQPVMDAFQALEESGDDAKLKEKNGGRPVLSGGSEISMNKEQFLKIRSEVKKVRNNITNTK